MRIILLILLSLFAIQPELMAQKKQITLMIDPGHGGNDPGHETTIAGHEDEKALNLKIAKFLGGYIEKYLQNVKVVYTRKSDKTVSLDARVDKANNINADYFISIHCNAYERKAVRGTESYVHLMTIPKAVSLAKLIEKQFSSRAGRRSRGVKDKTDLQHSLQVLKFTNMTSVLVECGYMTNPKEAAFLNTTYGQEIIASAIFRAFRTFAEQQHPNIEFRKKTPSTNNSSPSASTSYTIQIMSSKTPVDPGSAQFKKLKHPVERRKLNTTSAYKYIYTAGVFPSKSAAKNALPHVRKNGFRDAIIIRK